MGGFALLDRGRYVQLAESDCTLRVTNTHLCKLLFSRPPYPIKRGADSDLYQRQGLYAE